MVRKKTQPKQNWDGFVFFSALERDQTLHFLYDTHWVRPSLSVMTNQNDSKMSLFITRD